MAASLWVSPVAGAIWIASTTIFRVRVNLIEEPFQSVEAYEAVQWTNVVSGIAYPVFFVAFGFYVMLWLMSREDQG